MVLSTKIFAGLLIAAVGLFGLQAVTGSSDSAASDVCCCGPECPCEACCCCGSASCEDCQCTACECAGCGGTASAECGKECCAKDKDQATI